MADNDWLGGFTLEELLGAQPVTKTKKQLRQEAGKRSFLSATLGAPFRLVGAVMRLPFTLLGAVLKLPTRVLRLVTSPLRRKKS
jgi:hypothetical protein